MVSLSSITYGLQHTRKLYIEDAYLKEACSRVLRFVKEKGSKGYLVLVDTIFHPRSGAQANDLGIIESEVARIAVSKVMVQDGVIVHYGEFSDIFREGDIVKMRIDWDRRYKIMRSHTAGHIIDFAVSKVYGIDLVSISAMHDVGFGFQEYAGIISKPMQDEIEDLANHLVASNLTVRIEYVDSENLKKKIFGAPNLSKLPRLDTYRVVVIEGVNAIPCSGTHVMRTGEVGRIKIDSLDIKERSFRVSYRLSDA